MVGTCQLLAALRPLKIVLRFYIIDADVPTILGMFFLATVNPIDWKKCKVIIFCKSGQEDSVTANRPSL